jgi:hypothetical protein
VFKQEDIHKFDIDDYIHKCHNDSAPRVEIHEVYNLLLRIKSLVVGPDGIPTLVYKLFSEFLAVPLTILFNKSIKQGKVPSVWKCANVVPIPKTKDEFRPISLLCFPMKLLEKLILTKWLTPSLQRPFNTAQYAFVLNVKYGGCCNALTLARIWTLKQLDSGASYVRWLAIDFSKAFDTVSHLKIISTLVEHFKVNNQIIPWLCHYFEGRMQRVVNYEGGVCPYIPCSSGVPQGPILGPVLFAILLDPCLCLSTNSKFICYADDCTIMNSVLPLQIDTLQCDTDLFLNGTREQGLEINTGKCQIIIFTARTPPTKPPDIFLRGVALAPVESVKILGVWFTCDLKWSMHLNYVYKKCARASYLIKLLCNRGVKGTFLRTISNSLVFSPVFCDVNNMDLKKFIALEARIQLLCRSSTNPINLRTRLDAQCIRLAKKISSLHGHPLEECFQINKYESAIVLRKQRKFVPLRAKKCMLFKSFTRFAC